MLFFFYFKHTYACGNYCTDIKPDGNIVLVADIVNRPHNKGNYNNPFKKKNIFCIYAPCKHRVGDNRKPCYRIEGYGTYGKHGLN